MSPPKRSADLAPSPIDAWRMKAGYQLPRDLVAQSLAAHGNEGNEDATFDLAALKVAHRPFVGHAILPC